MVPYEPSRVVDQAKKLVRIRKCLAPSHSTWLTIVEVDRSSFLGCHKAQDLSDCKPSIMRRRPKKQVFEAMKESRFSCTHFIKCSRIELNLQRFSFQNPGKRKSLVVLCWVHEWPHWLEICSILRGNVDSVAVHQFNNA